MRNALLILALCLIGFAPFAPMSAAVAVPAVSMSTDAPEGQSPADDPDTTQKVGSFLAGSFGVVLLVAGLLLFIILVSVLRILRHR